MEVVHLLPLSKREPYFEGGSRKRVKLNEHTRAHLCPPANAEDEVTYGRNRDLLKSEMDKAKPRVDVLKDLMKRTFPNRWEAYVSQNEPPSLLEYLSLYPLLKKSFLCKCTIRSDNGEWCLLNIHDRCSFINTS